MATISPSFLSPEFFCKNSIFLRVRFRERFVNPQLLKQLAVYKIIERFCERNNFIQWFYKNGDKGTDYYSVLYEDNNGKQRAFYPDYVVGTVEGIWIIETKGGEDKSGNSQDIDKFSPKKFEALKNYVQIQQNDGKQIFGGFVRRDGSENLCICTDNYSEQIVTPNWKLLEEVFK